MYKQNDEQMLIHTKVTLGEHETKSITAFMSNNNLAYYMYTSLHISNMLRTKIFINCGLFLALQFILTIFFSVRVNISCNLSI